MTGTTTEATEAPLPSWFDAGLHHIASGGIYETATGTVLDEDGEPRSLALRNARAFAKAQAAEAAAAAAAPAIRAAEAKAAARGAAAAAKE